MAISYLLKIYIQYNYTSTRVASNEWPSNSGARGKDNSKDYGRTKTRDR